jgi:uncharacterized protein YprB with RNaseH-like and TPR domain
MADFGKALKQLRRSQAAPETAAAEFSSRFSLRRQLEFLKARYRIHAGAPAGAAHVPSGCIESTPFGAHYVVRTGYPADHFHGRIRLSRFSTEDFQKLTLLMREETAPATRNRVVFLDTETTGMQGGVGICPFLVGAGFFVDDEFQVVQYFIRDFDEEPSMLHALGDLLSRFEVIVTYNGAAFDIPLLENRFTLARFAEPFQNMAHFDLLFTARRLWRNGHGSCRLTALESEIVSFARGADVPGAAIPRIYFDFLNGRSNSALRGVFVHNVNDIVSLAALTIAASDRVTSEPAPLDEPLDLYSLARILESSSEWRRSISVYEMAIAGGLPEHMHLKALENLAVLLRRNGDHGRSLEICLNLMRKPGFSMAGYEGAATHYERIERNWEAARSVVREALDRLAPSSAKPLWRKLLERRWERLQQKGIRF